MKLKSKVISAMGGIGVGLINGLLGAGGGMLAVPLLKKCGLKTKEAHAGSIAVILPLSAISGVIYLLNSKVTLGDALKFMPTGAIGAVIGAWLLSKLEDKWLRRIFSVFMLWAGVRMMIK